MKSLNFIVLILCILAPLHLFAQSVSDIGKISIGVVAPNQCDYLSPQQMQLLQHKVEQICSREQVAPYNFTNVFFLRPDIDILNDELVEGGTQLISAIKAQLVLSVFQNDGTLFGSISVTIKGSGNSRQKAISNMLSGINIADPLFQSFLKDCKSKIIDYYQQHCEEVLLRASSLASQQNYEEAISTLLSIPECARCYQSVIQKVEEYYSKRQTHLCQIIQAQTQSALSVHNYEEAARLLSQIDPTSSCYSFAQETFKSIENAVTTEEKKRWDFMLKQYNDNISIEKQRIAAAKEVAISYYSHRSKVNNLVIIR